MEWSFVGPNYLATVKSPDGDFYISYLPPNASVGIPSMDAGPEGETALFRDSYYILEGDHRKQYEELAPKGYGACKQYYDQNRGKASTWSEE